MRTAQPTFGLTGMEPCEAGKRVGAIKSHDQPHDKLCVSRETTSANHEDDTGYLFGAETHTGGKTEAVLYSVPGVRRMG